MVDAATTDVIWLPAGVAAAMTGQSGRTLARLADAGRLRIKRTDGGHRRYRADEIQGLARADDETATRDVAA